MVNKDYQSERAGGSLQFSSVHCSNVCRFVHTSGNLDKSALLS